MERPQILIVEDGCTMRALLCELVQSAFPSCSVAGAPNGAKAMQLFQELQPRLVLMDLRLPDADGIDLTARMKSERPGVSVIVVSYHDGKDYMQRARTAGACAYVVKDHLNTDLVPAVSEVLGNAPPHAR